jgi:hypothetical protein
VSGRWLAAFGTGGPSTALPHLVQDGERSLVQDGERSLGVNPGVGHPRWLPRPVGVCRTGEPEHQRGTEDQQRNGECDSFPDGDCECGDRGSFPSRSVLGEHNPTDRDERGDDILGHIS